MGLLRILFGFCLLGIAAGAVVLDRRVVEAQNGAALEKQNQLLEVHVASIGGQFAWNLSQNEREMAQIGRKWEKRLPLQNFQGEVALSEPRKPHWMIFGKHRLRASGHGDEPMLESALEEHFAGESRWKSFQWKGKNYVFLRGAAEGVPYAAAFVADDLFSTLGAGTGLTMWVLDSAGQILYHPLSRFIGSQVANVRPVASGIARLKEGRPEGSKAFSQRFKNLEGKDTFGAFITVPSAGLLMGSEWSAVKLQGAMGSWLWWMAIFAGGLGLWVLARAFSRTSSAPREPQPFSEDRLPPEALDYLSQVRTAAEASSAEVLNLRQEVRALQERLREERESSGLEEWKHQQWQQFFRDVMPKALRGKEVWQHFLHMVARSSPDLDFLLYRYSPTTFSLVPEALELGGSWDGRSRAQLMDNRIYVGNERYLESLVHTESFRRWKAVVAKATGDRIHGFEAETLCLNGPGKHRGLLLVLLSRQRKEERDWRFRFEQTKEMSEKLLEFCLAFEGLLQSSYDEGGSKTLAGSANYSRGAPLGSSAQLSNARPTDWRSRKDSRAPQM